MANFTLSNFVATKISTKLANRLIGAANNYADGVGDTVGSAARSYADEIGSTARSYTNEVGDAVGSAARTYADEVGTSARSFASALVPTGTVILFAGSNIPEGFLLCNGAAVSKTTYSNLYAAIGDLYGASGDESKFLLPDMRDRYPCGAGTNAVGTYLAEQLPNITGDSAVVYVDQKYNTSRTRGAFRTVTTSTYVFNISSNLNSEHARWAELVMNASLVSSKYVDNGNVRPLTLNFDYVIKC